MPANLRLEATEAADTLRDEHSSGEAGHGTDERTHDDRG